MIDSMQTNKQTSKLTNLLLSFKRQVEFKTCGDVYEKWRPIKRLYKKAPKDGVKFQIDYIDTGLLMDEEVRAKAPIVLALHGAPGSYHDFALLIEHLSQQSVRVIAPNFPEYIATVQTKVLFRHSADEKAAYLRDFLRAINVKKIDLLVSHSSAIFPTLLILLNGNKEAVKRQKQLTVGDTDQQLLARNLDTKDETNRKFIVHDKRTAYNTNEYQDGDNDSNDDGDESEFKDAKDELDGNNNVESTTSPEKQIPKRSEQTIEAPSKKVKKKKVKRDRLEVIVHFDEPIEIKSVALFNPAGHRLPKSMKPTWFKCGSCRIYQHKLGRSIFRKFGPGFLTIVGVPVRVDNMDHVMLSATVMRNSRCERVVKQLEQLSLMKLPTLLVFSENDKLIEKEIFYEMAQLMKLDSRNFDTFNNDGEVELSQSKTEDWTRVMVFKAGGHYAYSHYAKTVNNAVSELLSKVVESQG